MSQCLFHLINQDQAQVAGVESAQRCINGLELTVDVLNMLGTAGLGEKKAG